MHALEVKIFNEVYVVVSKWIFNWYMEIGMMETDRYDEVVGFWDQIYGLKMTSMKPEVLREASIELVPTEKILSEAAVVLNLDLKTCHVQDTEFFAAFTLQMRRDDRLTALVGSFDVSFNLDETVILSTSPYDAPTHWKQTVFYLPQPMNVLSGTPNPNKCETCLIDSVMQ